MQQLFLILFFSLLCSHIPANTPMLLGQPLYVVNPWRTVIISRNRKLRRKKVHATTKELHQGITKIPYYQRVQNILNHKHIVIDVQKGKTIRKTP
jgi:hypothetical protein